MDDARIAELLEPFLRDGSESRHPESTAALSPAQLQTISMYIDLILHWNVHVNLTAIREREEIVTRHFGESIFAARQLFPQPEVGAAAATAHVIDIGSGAGFPGLPIKIWAPYIHLTLIESNQKKATFLREVVRSVKLANVEVFAGRAEAFHGTKGNVVTFRAVEQFESILRLAAGLVGESGRLAILIGRAQLNRVHGLLDNFKWEEPATLPLSSNRALLIGVKESGC